MSRHRAQTGTPGQVIDVLPGGTVDITGRLLSVAELQDALRLARSRSRPTDPATTPQSRDSRAVRVTSPPGDPMPPGPDSSEPDANHPTVPAGTAAQNPPPVTEPDPPTREWGANPVPVNGFPRQRPVLVTAPSAPAPVAGPGMVRFPVAELLRRPPRERDTEATKLLTGRWPGPRRVVFASLTGGTGRSTLAAVLCAAAADTGVPVLMLDGTGGDPRALSGRVGAGAVVTRRDWTRLAGVEAEVDFAALYRRTGPAGPAVTVVAVNGEQGSPPPAGAVAAAAAGVWPLVLVDLPHGPGPVRAAVRAGGIDLLVLECRADPAEITDTAGFLTELAADGEWDCAQRAVLAVRAERRGLPRPARRRLAAVSGTAAGPLTVPHLPRLVSRRTPAQGPDAIAAGRLLLAATAGAPPTTEPSPDPRSVDLPSADPAAAAASTTAASPRSAEK